MGRSSTGSRQTHLETATSLFALIGLTLFRRPPAFARQPSPQGPTCPGGSRSSRSCNRSKARSPRHRRDHHHDGPDAGLRRHVGRLPAARADLLRPVDRLRRAHGRTTSGSDAYRLEICRQKSAFARLPNAYSAPSLRLGKQTRPRRTASNFLMFLGETGAGEGIRTLDPNLGKVVLYP